MVQVHVNLLQTFTFGQVREVNVTGVRLSIFFTAIN
jgi:hypothetical protein